MSYSIFSFKGRLSRGPYWLLTLGCYATLIVLGVIISALADSKTYSTTAKFGTVICACAMIPAGIALLGAKVRRFHDRNKSGFWLLVWLIPTLGGIWILIECGCLRGTRGFNAYGRDPLDPFREVGAVFGDTPLALDELRR